MKIYLGLTYLALKPKGRYYPRYWYVFNIVEPKLFDSKIENAL